MIDYDFLEEQYEDSPRTEKMGKPQSPVNTHHDMLKRVENTRNRLSKERD
jgi:hypothetical protein